MILTSQDVLLATQGIDQMIGNEKRYAAYVERHDGSDLGFDHQFYSPLFFAENPHLLLPIGFDEYRVLDRATYGIDAEPYPAPSFEIHDEVPFENEVLFEYESIYRDRANGAWYFFEGFTTQLDIEGPTVDGLHFFGPPADKSRYVSADDWISTLEYVSTNPISDGHALWLPQAWTPGKQSAIRNYLASSTHDILRLLCDGERTLRDVGWKELEDVVAELLRDQGFSIHVTPRSHDGGRDIVGRSFAGNDPFEIAVEVKQKAVVGIADVQRVLQANQQYPLIMIATAGRFSAGAVRERSQSSNRLRLWLKDGIALSQWVDSYRGLSGANPRFNAVAE